MKQVAIINVDVMEKEMSLNRCLYMVVHNRYIILYTIYTPIQLVYN